MIDTSSAENPPKCDSDVYANGKSVMIMAGANATIIEVIVKEAARISGEPVDWHYFGGRANIMTTGDAEKVREVLTRLVTLQVL